MKYSCDYTIADYMIQEMKIFRMPVFIRILRYMRKEESGFFRAALASVSVRKKIIRTKH